MRSSCLNCLLSQLSPAVLELLFAPGKWGLKHPMHCLIWMPSSSIRTLPLPPPKLTQDSPMEPSRPPTMRQGLFNSCQNFTVSAGSIFNIQGNMYSSVADESDFAIIKLGHLNFLNEVGKQPIVEYRDILRARTGAVIRRVPVIVGLRRIYHTRIHGSQETFTAVVYEGSQFGKAC
ncbi:hypothetical protein B0H13DRAFT_1877097 [Mycena leptocephala]|nr:hypothetical protein B0H13DRAFT_1877097 [Mycena leptocephala]